MKRNLSALLLLSFLVLFSTSTSKAQNSCSINVETPGTLWDLLPGEIYENITEITITGKLNSSDARTLRAICGGNEKGFSEPGILQKIDLSGIEFVKGGDYYAEIKENDGSLKKYYIEQSDEIPDKLFYNCTSIEQIILPQKITAIGVGAFFNCFKLKSVTIPDQVTEIRSTAFGVCHALESIQLPSKLTSLGAYMFIYNKSLKHVVIPEGVKEFKTRMFQESAVETIELPQHMESIATEAFLNAGNLVQITIPEGVESIEPNTFYGCGKLTDVTLPTSLRHIRETAFQECSSLARVNFPEGLLDIGRLAFSSCTMLEAVSFPSTLVEVQVEAFTNCTGLTSCNLGTGLKRIGEMAFWHCMGIETLEIPASMKYVGIAAFAECMGLKEVKINSADVTLDSNPFLGCMNLERFVVHEENLYFKEYKGGLYSKDGRILHSFANMSGKTCDMLPETIKTDDFALWFCNNLEEINIPRYFAEFGYRTFCGCSGVKKITIRAPEPVEYAFVDDLFESIDVPNCELWVPEKSIEAYRASQLWGRFKIMALPSSINDVVQNGCNISILPSLLRLAQVPASYTQASLIGISGNTIVQTVLQDGCGSFVTNHLPKGIYVLMLQGSHVVSKSVKLAL